MNTLKQSLVVNQCYLVELIFTVLISSSSSSSFVCVLRMASISGRESLPSTLRLKLWKVSRALSSEYSELFSSLFDKNMVNQIQIMEGAFSSGCSCSWCIHLLTCLLIQWTFHNPHSQHPSKSAEDILPNNQSVKSRVTKVLKFPNSRFFET